MKEKHWEYAILAIPDEKSTVYRYDGELNAEMWSYRDKKWVYSVDSMDSFYGFGDIIRRISEEEAYTLIDKWTKIFNKRSKNAVAG